MPKVGRTRSDKKQIAVALPRETYMLLKAEAETKGISIPEVVRQVIHQHQTDRAAKIGAYVVEDAVRRVTGPQIDRLADLIAHTAIAAGTSAWLVRALLNLTTDVNTQDAWDQAVAESRAGLHRVFTRTEND
jgi:hypothetical protein